MVKKRFLSIDSALLLESMFSDKKKLNKKLRFVLLRKIGEAFLLEENIDDQQVLQAIQDARERFSQINQR